MYSQEVIDRFWNKVRIDDSDECWIWIGAKARYGYGHLTINKRQYSAHRVSWELAFGPVPGNLLVLHRCDNPPCVNPAHLWIGTYSDNAMDAVSKGRHGNHAPKNPERGERHHAAKLTETDVLEIRRLYKSGSLVAHLARSYGLHYMTVSDIVHRRKWRHLP